MYKGGKWTKWACNAILNGKQIDGPPLSGISIYKYIFIKINILYKMSVGNVFYRQKKKELDSKRGPRLGSGSASRLGRERRHRPSQRVPPNFSP